MQEHLFGIRVIKAYAWEDQAEEQLRNIRGGEVHYLQSYFSWSGLFFGLSMTFPRLIVTGVLSAYTILYKGLPAADIFVLVTLLGAFQAAVTVLANCLPMIVMAGPALGRLQKFFNLPEAELPGLKREERPAWCQVWPAPPLPGDLRIGAKLPRLQVQGSFSWTPEAAPSLHDLNVSVEHRQRVAVLGEVGSGKSTLLHAMLGELVPVKDARANLPDKIAYHSQVAYVCEGTLKENILFHETYDEERYNQAIFAASLRQDLGVLPGGDGVPVGSRGITLSGGQRSRVSIARAAYSWGTDVVLLDDPFASLDRSTGQHVLQHCVMGPLMRDRICVVVMQPDENVLKHFDQVIIMANGAVAVQGPPSEVTQTAAYKKLLAMVDTQQGMELSPQLPDSPIPDTSRMMSPTLPTQDTNNQQLRDDESEGRFDMATFKMYLNIGGNAMAFLCVAFFAVQVLCNLLSDMVMARWTNTEVRGEAAAYAQQHGGKADPSQTSINMLRYLLGMTFWMAISWLMFAGSFYCGTQFTMTVSSVLHSMVTKRLLRAPIDRFYDKTPVGRILNRMSADLMQIDMKMYFQLTASIGQLIWWGIPMFYVHAAMPMIFSICMLPWYWLLYTIFRRYMNVAVPLRYLERTTRSEVNVYISEVQNSKTSVRAYQVAKQFSAAMMSCQDNMLNSQFASDCVKRWVCNRMMVLYCFFSTSVALVGIMAPMTTSTGAIALCLSNAVGIIMKVDFVMEQLTAAQFQFVSMNRLCEYLSIPQEREDNLPGDAKLMNKSHDVKRESLGKLEVRKSEETGLISIVRVDQEQAGSVEQSIFDQLPDGKSFAFSSLRATRWLSSLSKPNATDWRTHYTAVLAGQANNETRSSDLDISHCLVGVNATWAFANAMAEELCNGTDGDVLLQFQSSWRMGGAHIKITDLVAGYADIPVDVLKGISLTIEPRSKVAICGTTGCGKSTTILCMLRILEPRSGKIAINHINTQDIGLRALRRACGLVPQDPIVFTGTIKHNLDPLTEYPDAILWGALKAVQLAEFVWLQGEGLQMNVQADGANLSFGQRQLLCVARMIIRQPSLLLLDECTSAIDPRTQERAQSAIREAFPNSTLMVVAHRLETILDFDHIVVLDRGHIAEEGSVKDLANKQSGLFNKMLHAHSTPMK